MAAGRRRARRGIDRGRRLEARERDRLQHRLVVLLLVAEDELGEHAVAAAVQQEHGAHPLAHQVEVVERLGAVEQRQVAADRARGLERVVHRGQLGLQQRGAAVAVDEPQVLVGGDVREVPDQRAHQLGVGRLDVGVGQRGDERERALAGLVERFDELRLAAR